MKKNKGTMDQIREAIQILKECKIDVTHKINALDDAIAIIEATLDVKELSWIMIESEKHIGYEFYNDKLSLALSSNATTLEKAESILAKLNS